MNQITIEEISTKKCMGPFPRISVSYTFRGKKYGLGYDGRCCDIGEPLLEDLFIICGHVEVLYTFLIPNVIQRAKSYNEDIWKKVDTYRGMYEIVIYPQTNKVIIPELCQYCNVCDNCEGKEIDKLRFCTCCRVGVHDRDIKRISKLVEEKLIRKHDLRIIADDLIVYDNVT